LANLGDFDMVNIDNNLGVNHEMCVPNSLFDNLIWGIDEVCHFTKYAKGTVYNLVSSGEIPYRRGRKRKLIFIPSEIIQWLKGE
jgi:predicted DNA-binding transcriptional regulator AlpA